MNHCVPDWNLDDGNRSFGDLLPTANQKKSTAPDNELIELLWRNGHVVMHSQAQRNSPTTVTEFKQTPKPGPSFKCGDSLVNSGDLIREEETSSWFQYSLDDPLEKELCSGFFSGMPVADAADADKLNKDAAAGEKDLNFETKEINAFAGSATKHSNLSFEEHMMPTPKSHVTGSTQQAPSLEKAGIVNFAHFSRPTKVDLGFSNGQLEHNGSQYRIPLGMGESSSMVTIGSSASGDNQVQNRVDEGCTFSNDARNAHIRSGKDDVQMSSPREGVQTNAYEANATSSSGGSGSSFGRTGQRSASNLNHKRKGRGGESECHSEEAEYESVKANKRAQRSASARRTRAAEVHNLSERRRRDRINEKMRALQELIPHCNKTDKASMLDEAIEYLKSLQLQVQMMWMGSGMAPMMLPGFQPYMSRMGMGMGHAPMPSFQSPIQLPRVPLANQNHTPVFPSPALNPDNFPTQMQNIHLSESYARYLSFHHVQPPPQVMDLYASGSHTMQQNQQAAAAVPSEKIQNDQTG